MANRKLTRKEKVSTQANAEALPKANNPARAGWGKWYPLVVLIVGMLVYANTFQHSYALDDYSLILENNSTKKGFDAIGEIFKTSYRFGYYFSSDELYRPLSKSVLAIEWGLAPNKPGVAHFLNVLIFAFSGYVLYKSLLRWLKGNAFVAFAASLLFVVHPIHTEVVGNIKSIDEILGFLFGILALDAAFRYATTAKVSTMLTSALWFFCALLSKESSITFLAVMPLVIYYFADKKDAKSYMPVGLALLVTVLFMAIRTKVLGGATVSLNASVIDNMLMAAHNKLEQLTTAVYLLGLYLKTMVIPYPLSFDRSFPDLNIVTMTDLRFIVSALVLLGMLALAIVSFRKKDILSFAMFFFFITASVSSNIFVLIGTHWGERLMYTPVFAFCLVVAVLLQRYVGGAGKTASAKNAIAVIVVITIAFGGMTLARNPVWKNNSSLYLSGLSSAPNSARVQYYMGNNMIKEDQLAGKTKEQQDSIVYAGIDYLKTAVKLYPPFTDAWNQMGVAYYRLKVIDQALVCYRKGVSLNPNDATLQSNLGTALYAQAKYPEALQAFQSAVAINPNYVEAWSNIGSTYGLMGNYDAAIPAFEKAIAINPNYAQAYFFLGITWQNKGNVMLANQYLEKAYALEPSLRR